MSGAATEWPSLSGSGIFFVKTVASGAVWNNLIQQIFTRYGHYTGLTSFCWDRFFWAGVEEEEEENDDEAVS